MERLPTTLQDALWLRPADRAVEQDVEARARRARENIWANLPELYLSPKTVAESRLVSVDRSDPAHMAFDMIRTKAAQSLKENGWISIAITSPTAKCGKSHVALNLAFSFANQKDCKTMLFDMNLKQPTLDKLLGIANPPSMEALLSGRGDPSSSFRCFNQNLAIGANNSPVNFSSELLQSADAARALKDVQQSMKPDVILFDMTSMLPSDDVTAFLPNVDCAILVAAAEQSTFDEVDTCERELAERTNLLGVVLNRCRHAPTY